MKRADDPSKVLQFDKVRRWLALSHQNAWAIGGHTRHATHGAVNKDNAHPFRYGEVVGTHNGMVQAPVNYEVDSQYLFDIISTDGYTELAQVRGYWGLAWLDRKARKFYLTKHSGNLACAAFNGVLYYSSDKDHLASIVDTDPIEILEGQVLCFHADGTVKDSSQGQIAKIDAQHDYWDWDVSYYGNKGRNSSSGKGGIVRTYGTSSYGTGTADKSAPKGDDWNEAWDRYFHSMSDEEFKAWEHLV